MQFWNESSHSIESSPSLDESKQILGGHPERMCYSRGMVALGDDKESSKVLSNLHGQILWFVELGTSSGCGSGLHIH